MANINLITREEEVKTSSLGKTWGVFILVILALLIVYIGIFNYNRWLSQDLEKRNMEYEAKYASLLEKGKSVFDFQNRLRAAKSLVENNNYVLESLRQIEKTVMPEVYIESFNFDSKKGQIDLTYVAGHYGLVANQIASLKKINYFSEVTVNKTATRDDGKIEFLAELIIKK